MSTDQSAPREVRPREVRPCAAGCGTEVLADTDGKSYVCRKCWSRFFRMLFEAIRPAPEPDALGANRQTTPNTPTETPGAAT